MPLQAKAPKLPGMWLVKILLGIALVYAAIVATAYVAQSWLIFPTGLTERNRPNLPDYAVRLELATPEGELLTGVHLPPQVEAGRGALLLGFGGNAWNAEALALYLHQLFPERDIVAFHYRGYSPSAGTPSAQAIVEDAALIHDHVQAALGPIGVVAVGLSIGSGPATRLAADRKLTGLILVTPFDSLENLASRHYPWLPVRLLLRHRMPVAALLESIKAPTAIIVAGNDTTVPASISAPVRQAPRNLILERTIEGAGHNDLYGREDFARTMLDALRLIEETAQIR